jgi:hypothetical protein
MLITSKYISNNYNVKNIEDEDFSDVAHLQPCGHLLSDFTLATTFYACATSVDPDQPAHDQDLHWSHFGRK